MDATILDRTEAGSARSGTFLPGDEPGSFDELLDAVWRNRFTTFLALQGEMHALCPADCESTGFLAAAFDMICLDAPERRTLVNHPVFQAWVGLALQEASARLTGRTDDPQPLRDRLAAFCGMLERVREAVRNPFRPAFHRLDMDPLIAAMLPPSYQVPDDLDARAAASRLGHPLSFFKDVAHVALDRVQATWPQARRHFDRLVHAVCYLPDANFRSCSASRYTGVILLSSRDQSLLDLEESLVHEAGHQLLYNIVEVHPIVEAVADGQHSLPWSGQVRDLYGYFHAFFIYVLLAQYHERAMGRPEPDGSAATARVRHILRGLITAVPDFQASPYLTLHGRALLDALAGDIAALEARHQPLLRA